MNKPSTVAYHGKLLAAHILELDNGARVRATHANRHLDTLCLWRPHRLLQAFNQALLRGEELADLLPIIASSADLFLLLTAIRHHVADFVLLVTCFTHCNIFNHWFIGPILTSNVVMEAQEVTLSNTPLFAP